MLLRENVLDFLSANPAFVNTNLIQRLPNPFLFKRLASFSLSLIPFVNMAPEIFLRTLLYLCSVHAQIFNPLLITSPEFYLNLFLFPQLRGRIVHVIGKEACNNVNHSIKLINCTSPIWYW